MQWDICLLTEMKINAQTRNLLKELALLLMFKQNKTLYIFKREANSKKIKSSKGYQPATLHL